MKKERFVKNKKLRIVIASLHVAVLIGLGVLVSVMHFTSRDTMVDYSDGWSLTYEGKIYNNVNLHEFVLEHPARRGDELVMTKKLNTTVYPGECLRMLTYLSTVEVTYDGIPVYHYGREDIAKRRMVGNGYHIIRLQKFMEGRIIRISVVATESGAFTNIDPIYLMPANQVMPSNIENHVWSVFTSIFLFMLGIMIGIACIIPTWDWEKRARLLLIGFFAMLVGMWDMASAKLLQLLSLNYSFNSTLEYLSLYLAPIPLMLLITSMQWEHKGWKYNVLRVMTLGMIIFDIVAVVLHFANVVHFSVVLPYFHIYAAACLVSAIITSIQPVKNMTRQERVMMWGLLVLFGTVGLDLIRFNVQKYIFPTEIWLQETVLPIGALVFICFLLLGYLMHLHDIMIHEVERDMLTSLAYQDTMTGLFNRSKILELFDELIQKDDKVSLILFDVNGLKKTNDSLGHAKGDLLIKSFAKVLKDSFGNLGYCARIGGDEFVALIPSGHANDISKATKKFLQEEDITSKEIGFPVRASYGVASCDEVREKSLEEVYRLADARMYMMKQQMKADELAGNI